MLQTSSVRQVLVNAPIRVDFAGLQGTTRSMQEQGWELGVEVEKNYAYHAYTARLTGRHKGLNLMMYSGVAQFDISSFMREDFSYFNEVCFPIAANNIASNIVIPAAPRAEAVRMTVDFTQPFMRTVSMDEMVSLEDVFFFQPFNEEKSLYLPDQKILEVQDYLDNILEGQKEKQKEIREKKRRMKGKGGTMKSESDFNTNPDVGQVKLQLVSV